MKQHKHAELIKSWADGAKIEYLDLAKETWYVVDSPAWMVDAIYRIKDHYAALKAAAADPTKQIRLIHSDWRDFGYKWSWNFKPEDYEIRDKPDPYAELKKAAADPTKVVWDYVADVEHVGDFSGHIPACHYEIRDKPKPKVKMWQWIYQGEDKQIYTTARFFTTCPISSFKWIGPALWTEIEVEE